MSRRLMDQLPCAMLERGDIGLIVIGRGKRKSIESVTKVYRKCCETNSKGIRGLAGLIFTYRMDVGAEPGAGAFQSPPEAYLGLSELLSLERCRGDKRVSWCCSVAAGGAGEFRDGVPGLQGGAWFDIAVNIDLSSFLRFSTRRRRFFGHSLVNSLKGVCPLI